jgi:sugar phosphate isomerase/epimerase
LPAFATRHEFDGLELSDRLLVGLDGKALCDLGRDAADCGCGLILDVNCDLTYGDGARREEELTHVQRMLEAAAALHANPVRLCLGGQSLSIQRLVGRPASVPRAGSAGRSSGSPSGLSQWLFSQRLVQNLSHELRRRLPSPVLGERAKIARAADALRRLLPAAESLARSLAIENHWGISARPQNITRLVKELNSSHLGTCPDIGNFPRDVDTYDGLRLLAPRARVAHAKSIDFDENGEERTIDYGRCLGILRDSGFDGPWTVEYLGGGDEVEGCRRTRELIRRHLA